MPKIIELQGGLINWANAGFACTKKNTVYRFQPAYPNTFVLIWYGATIGGVARDWVCQDVHYSDTGNFVALGGFWIRGVDGASKHEQHWRNKNNGRAKLYTDVKAQVPVSAPDKTNSLTWTTVMDYLQGR